jgi:hypothetical protein
MFREQTIELEKIVRKESGRLNEAHTILLLDNELDDPVALSDHFETFPPVGSDKQRAESFITRERDRIRVQNNREIFDKESTGIRM